MFALLQENYFDLFEVLLLYYTNCLITICNYTIIVLYLCDFITVVIINKNYNN